MGKPDTARRTFTREGRKQPAERWAREGQALAQAVSAGGKAKLAGAGLNWQPTWARWPAWSLIWALKSAYKMGCAGPTKRVNIGPK